MPLSDRMLSTKCWLTPLAGTEAQGGRVPASTAASLPPQTHHVPLAGLWGCCCACCAALPTSTSRFFTTFLPRSRLRRRMRSFARCGQSLACRQVGRSRAR